MTVREYMGARYVPLFMGDWDVNADYEPLSIVNYQGNSYTSRQAVPHGVEITNEQYWAQTGNYNAQVESYRQEVLTYNGRIEAIENGLPIADFDSENTVKSAIDANALAISNEISARETQDAIRVLFFDTVADMKASADIYNGAICKTKGFYTANDGGSAWYIVSNSGTANEMDVIACGSLYAVMMADKQVSVLQFGCKNDESTDVTACLNYILENYRNVFIPDGTYLIDGLADGTEDGGTIGVLVKSNTSIELGENATIKQTQNGNKPFSYILNVYNADNVRIKGGKLLGDKATHVSSGSGTDEWGTGLNISYSSNVIVEDMVIEGCHGDGIYIGQTYFADGIMAKNNKNVHIENVKVYNTYRNGIAVCDCNDYFISNSVIDTVSGTAPQVGIDIELEGPTTPALSNGHIENVNIYNTASHAIAINGETDSVDLKGIDCTKNLVLYSGTKANVVNSRFNYMVANADTELFADNCRFQNMFSTNESAIVTVTNSYFADFKSTILGDAKIIGCVIDIPVAPITMRTSAYSNIEIFESTFVFHDFDASLDSTYWLLGFGSDNGVEGFVKIDNCLFKYMFPSGEIKKSTLRGNDYLDKFIVTNNRLYVPSGVSVNANYAFIACNNGCMANGNNIAPYTLDVNGTNVQNAVNFSY